MTIIWQSDTSALAKMITSQSCALARPTTIQWKDTSSIENEKLSINDTKIISSSHDDHMTVRHFSSLKDDYITITCLGSSHNDSMKAFQRICRSHSSSKSVWSHFQKDTCSIVRGKSVAMIWDHSQSDGPFGEEAHSHSTGTWILFECEIRYSSVPQNISHLRTMQFKTLALK